MGPMSKAFTSALGIIMMFIYYILADATIVAKIKTAAVI
jgi:hypothetical protein